MTSKRYLVSGDVRGDCGHHHRTMQGAAACLKRDKRGCEAQGGYSDRRIYTPEGRIVFLGDIEADEHTPST